MKEGLCHPLLPPKEQNIMKAYVGIVNVVRRWAWLRGHFNYLRKERNEPLLNASLSFFQLVLMHVYFGSNLGSGVTGLVFHSWSDLGQVTTSGKRTHGLLYTVYETCLTQCLA